MSRSLGVATASSIGVLVVSAAVGSSSPGFGDFGTIASPDLLDYLVVGGIVFVSSLAGHFAYWVNQHNRLMSMRWTMWSLWFVFVISLIVIGFGLIVTWVFNSINPVFGFAENPVSAAASPIQGFEIAIALFVVLLFLPSILFYIISFIFGSSIGLTGEFSGFSDILFSLGLSEFIGGQSISLGAASAIGLVLAFAVSVFAGAAAGEKVGITSKHPTAVIAVFFSSMLVAVVGARLSSFGISSTNGVEFATADSPAPFSFEAIFGVLLPSILFVAIVVTIGAYLGGIVFQTTVVSSNRGFTSILIQRNLMSRSVGFEGIVLGALMGIVVFSSAAVPWTIATVNKAMTALSGPEEFAEAWLGFYEDDVETALRTVSPQQNFVPEEVLLRALPKGYSAQITSTNSIGEDWVPGNLQAETSTEVSVGDESFEIIMRSRADIKNDFPLTYSDFSHRIAPATLSFEKVGAASGSDEYPLTVNGKPLDFRSYGVIPGVYEINIPDNGMVSGFQDTVYISSGETLEIQVGEKTLLTDREQNLISTALLAPESQCQGSASDDEEICASIEDLRSAAELDPSVPNQFAVLETTSDSVLATLNIDKEKTAETFEVKCTEPVIGLTSTSESLPQGVQRDISTAFGYTVCSYSLTYADIYFDNVVNEEYRLDYVSVLNKEFVVTATADNGRVTIGEAVAVK